MRSSNDEISKVVLTNGKEFDPNEEIELFSKEKVKAENKKYTVGCKVSPPLLIRDTNE